MQPDRQGGDHRQDRKIEARDREHPWPVALRNEGRFLRREPAAGMDHQLAKRSGAALQREQVEQQAEQMGRSLHGDLRVAPDDDGVGVMPGVAPAPDFRLAHDHEAGELIDRIVHPACLEGGAMAAFMPA